MWTAESWTTFSPGFRRHDMEYNVVWVPNKQYIKAYAREEIEILECIIDLSQWVNVGWVSHEFVQHDPMTLIGDILVLESECWISTWWIRRTYSYNYYKKML